jgi:hypothetical protein
MNWLSGVVVAFVVAVALWAAATGAAQAPTRDSVTGALAIEPVQCGVNCFSPPRYVFNASSGPSGENPTGTVNFATGERLGLVVDIGSVTCLRVIGRAATIGVNFTDFIGQLYSAVLFVEDKGGEGDDLIAVQHLPGLAPPVCPAERPPGLTLEPTFAHPFEDLYDLTVTDATAPLPTSKDQCKNGGWRNFGVFKNQGDCVSYVATGGKNEPGD